MRSAVLSRALAPSLALALGFITTACDEGQPDEPGGVAANCPAVVQAICDSACDCGGAAGCTIAGDSGDPEDWIAFDDKSDCVMVYSFSCGSNGQGSSQVDYAACARSLNEPACKPISGGQAFSFPEACQPPPE